MAHSITYKIVEIFKSIEGEGIRSGYPTTFIRFYGCNLNCSYCDTRYACENDEYEIKDLEEIVNELKKLGAPRVTLTGGEPLIQEHIEDLVEILESLGYEINIETNGSVDLSTFKFLRNPNVFVTLDYKCNSSKMNSSMILENYYCINPDDVIKFVVGTIEDLDQILPIYNLFNSRNRPHIFVSPVAGKIDPQTIVQYLLENDLYDARIQLQLHKLIWSPETRGV